MERFSSQTWQLIPYMYENSTNVHVPPPPLKKQTKKTQKKHYISEIVATVFRYIKSCVYEIVVLKGDHIFCAEGLKGFNSFSLQF